MHVQSPSGSGVPESTNSNNNEKLTGNHSPAQPAYAHHLAPVLPINLDNRPSFLAPTISTPELLHPRTRVIRNTLSTTLILRRIQLGIIEAGPHTRDTEGISSNSDTETTMHIGRELEARADCRRSIGRRSSHRKTREPVRYGF